MRLVELSEQLWKSQRGLLILLAALLALNLLAYLVIDQWLVPEVTAQESRFLKKQAEVRQLLHTQGATAKTPEQLYALVSQDLAKFHQAVPEYQEFTGLIEELLVLADRARLNIAQITYASEQLQDGPLLKINLSFNVTGPYPRIKQFIFSLEQSVRLLTIKQISLQGVENDDVNLQLSLESFFRQGGGES